jgi:CheY-like chemotaxis protein
VLEQVGEHETRVRVVLDHDDAAMLDPPDLVLVDVNMPALSGEGLVAVLRGREQTRDVPVLLHSSNDEVALAAAARRLGIEGWVAKGDPDELRRKVAAAVGARTGPA